MKPKDGAKNVALVKPTHVSQCEKMATTTSTVREKVGIVARKSSKVADELIILAKNEAAKLGGDTIVALDRPVEGSQRFDIYKCQM